MKKNPKCGYSGWTWTIATKGTITDPDFTDGIVIPAPDGPWRKEFHLVASHQQLTAAPMSVMLLMNLMPEGFWERDVPM